MGVRSRDAVSQEPRAAQLLRDLPRGARATVLGVEGATPATCARLRDLGFRPGCEVTCVRRAPWGSPVLFRVGESDLCLRRDLSSLVRVEVLV